MLQPVPDARGAARGDARRHRGPRSTPGEPHAEDDFPDPEQARFPLLPRTLGEALDALHEQDEVVRAALPGDLYDTFVAIKRDEWHRACGAVTEWDRETYLNYLP